MRNCSACPYYWHETCHQHKTPIYYVGNCDMSDISTKFNENEQKVIHYLRYNGPSTIHEVHRELNKGDCNIMVGVIIRSLQSQGYVENILNEDYTNVNDILYCLPGMQDSIISIKAKEPDYTKSNTRREGCA